MVALHYPLEKFDSAKLEVLPSSPGSAARPALVIRARYESGGAGELRATYVWTDTKFGDQVNDIEPIFLSTVGEAGEQEFVRQGPLAGAFVVVNQLFLANVANLESPAHYQMTIYEPVRYGYVKVLSMLSEKRYPSNHTGDGLPDAIATLTPEMSRALKAIYPHGVSANFQ